MVPSGNACLYADDRENRRVDRSEDAHVETSVQKPAHVPVEVVLWARGGVEHDVRLVLRVGDRVRGMAGAALYLERERRLDVDLEARVAHRIEPDADAVEL